MDASPRQLRADFDAQGGRSLALPLAGAIVWAVIGVASLFLTPRISTFVLIIGTGAIFPIGLLLARLLSEKLLNNTNPLARLMAMCVLMVNLCGLFTSPCCSLRRPSFPSPSGSVSDSTGSYSHGSSSTRWVSFTRSRARFSSQPRGGSFPSIG